MKDNENIKPKATLKDYIIVSCLGLAVALGIMALKGIFTLTEAKAVLHTVCDGFFIAGVILAGMAGLSYCGNEGTFDMLFFGVKQVVRTFSQKDLSKGRQTFYDYRKQRMENPKPVLYILLIGLAFILIAGIILLIYNTL
ncbi:MAG: DUF3899 domain-containing protein [Clostridia bacterium]|nr:DUF3899 domain-containing protein [Clostridia bacterium]